MRSFISILAFLLACLCNAQLLAPVVELDTNLIRIGEQATITLSVPYDANEPNAIDFPEIYEQVGEQLEVIQSAEVTSELQTPDSDPYLMVKRQQIIVTAWDSGFAAIPPLSFRINGTEVMSEALLLEVQGIHVDTTGAYKPVTDIERLPFSVLNWLGQHWEWFAGGAAALALAFLIFFLLKKRKQTVAPEAPKVIVPLHVRTLEELERIQQRELWQKGKTKRYYSEVTDALRAYIEERYNVPALERTTFELKRELKMSGMSREHQELLIANLEQADMVKFAKYKPIGAENEALLEHAFRFVRESSMDQFTSENA